MSDVKDQKNILRPHQFDGIQEYENQLPRWWVGMFYLSIAFAGAYLYLYGVDEVIPSLNQAYERSKIEEASRLSRDLPPKQQLPEDQLLAIALKPEVIKKGSQEFQTKCASCHAADGGGIVGPNLTDDYWIHGNSMTDLIKVITEGVATKGMPTWGAMMTAEEIQAVAAYVRSLRGQKPLHPKSPEGILTK
jgi:cytochrome c oxidase cbb3-type subunit 3